MDELDAVLERTRARRQERAHQRFRRAIMGVTLVGFALLAWIGWSLHEVRIALKPLTDQVREREAAQNRWRAMTPAERSRAIQESNMLMLKDIEALSGGEFNADEFMKQQGQQ